MKAQKIAIFASGSGSNAQKISEYFKEHPLVKVDCILSNKQDAYVLQRAADLGIDSFVFNRSQFYESKEILTLLQKRAVDWIVLAGFLWLVPQYLVDAYPNKIVNIHPALLPIYGGKGMYGSFVHETVIKNHEKESGITIHYVNPEYDKGNIIFQATCPVSEEDTPELLAEKVHALEYEHYPRVIEQIVRQA